QARTRGPSAARHRQAWEEGLRRSLRRLVPRPARSPPARDSRPRQGASRRPLRCERRVASRRRAHRRRARSRQHALVTGRLRALAPRVSRRRRRALTRGRGMSRFRALAYWTLRAAVTAALLAYISYDVDHADLRAALSAVHIRDLMLPLGLYLAG